MKTKTLSVDVLRTDGDTQSRIAISEDTVTEYAELIASSNGEWTMGPVDVFHDGTDYFVADGFHRTMAALRTGRASIPCRIHKGTAKDARIFGMTANDRHGLRMSRADKRACVEWLLDNGGKMTQAELAQKAGVCLRLVSKVVADRKSTNGEQFTVQNAHYAHSQSKNTGVIDESQGRTDRSGEAGTESGESGQSRNSLVSRSSETAGVPSHGPAL